MGEPSTKKCASLYGEDCYSHVTPGLIYIETSCAGPGLDIEMFEATPKGCDCTEDCTLTTCSCLKQSNSYDGDGLFYLRNSSLVDFDINRELSKAVIECNIDCSCDSFCKSRLVQNGPRLGLDIRENEKGLGMFTKRDIFKGSFVCEYAGELIGIEEAKRRFSAQLDSNASNYILVLKEHVGRRPSTSGDNYKEKSIITVIDPTFIGNIGRYINHSCSPNLGLVPVRINSLLPIGALFALRDIRGGEELCYNYDSVSDTEGNALKGDQGSECTTLQRKCLCGSSNCSGFLPANKDLF